MRTRRTSVALLAAAALAGVAAAGCGGGDSDQAAAPAATREKSADGGATAYREAVEKVNQELSGGPSLSEAQSDASIRKLAEYQRDSYGSGARMLARVEPPAEARKPHEDLTGVLERDASRIAKLLRSGAGRSKLYAAVTASRREVIPQIEDLAATASRLEISAMSK